MSFNRKSKITQMFNQVGSTRVVYKSGLLGFVFRYGWVWLFVLAGSIWLTAQYQGNKEIKKKSAALADVKQRIANAKNDDNSDFNEVDTSEANSAAKVREFINKASSERLARKVAFQPKVREFSRSLPIDWAAQKPSDYFYFDGRFVFALVLQPNGEVMPPPIENTAFSRKWEANMSATCTATFAVYERQEAELDLSIEDFFAEKVLKLTTRVDQGSASRFMNLVENWVGVVSFSLEPTSSSPGAQYIVRDYTHSMTVASMKGPDKDCLSRFKEWEAKHQTAEIGGL
jgi:hypothetical protein